MQMQANVAKQSTKRRDLNHRGKEVVRNGMNDTCIIIQRGHHLVSTSRTKPRVNMTISLQIKLSEVLFGYGDVLWYVQRGRWPSLIGRQT